MTIPASLYVDSCVFIAAFEEISGDRSPARELLHALADVPGAAITSELTLAELIAPSPNAVMSLEERRDLYLDLFDEVGLIELIPVTRTVLLATADIRKQHSFRLADAIHVATAVTAGCRYFMSFDRDARRVPRGLTWLTPSQGDVDKFLADHA